MKCLPFIFFLVSLFFIYVYSKAPRDIDQHGESRTSQQTTQMSQAPSLPGETTETDPNADHQEELWNDS